MRAGPLSNKKIIELLNSYFVPVFVVNEDYARRGPAPAEEKAERDRIMREGHEAKLSVGTVHVYLLRPDGHILDSMHVANAARTTNLIAMLEKAVGTLKVAAGKPLAVVTPQAARPSCSRDSLALHLVSRSLDGRGAWSEFPVENWIVLDRAEQEKLLPSHKLQVGDTWNVPSEVAEKIVTHFYPATENNDVSKNRFEENRLVAKVLSIKDGNVTARLDGNIKMHHSFYHKEDGKMVDAKFVGMLEGIDNGIRRLQMATTTATYGGGQFGVAVHSVP